MALPTETYATVMHFMLSGPRHQVTFRTGHMGYTFRFLQREVWIPWKECSVMDERLRFVGQLLDGEPMSEVCRSFGISRKTGYKTPSTLSGAPA